MLGYSVVPVSIHSLWPPLHWLRRSFRRVKSLFHQAGRRKTGRTRCRRKNIKNGCKQAWSPVLRKPSLQEVVVSINQPAHVRPGGRRFRSHPFTTGFAIGALFSLMSASFAYEDPVMRQTLTTAQKTSEIFKEMGRNMWRSGKGFGKVGAIFAGIECVLESVSTTLPYYNRYFVQSLMAGSRTHAVPRQERYGEPRRCRIHRRRDPRTELRAKSSPRGRTCLCSILGCDRSLFAAGNTRVRSSPIMVLRHILTRGPTGRTKTEDTLHGLD